MHFQDALRFLLRGWRAEAGLDAELREYLIGLGMVTLEEADKVQLGHFGRMLASDILRLHRASVETNPDALTRCRLVASQERALSKLGLRGVKGRVMPWGEKPRVAPPTRRLEG